MEVLNRWNSVILNRANLDVKMTNKKLSKKAIPQLIVEETWEDTGIVDLNSRLNGLEKDQEGGVLVGMRPQLRDGVG